MAIYPLIRRHSLNRLLGDFEREMGNLIDRNQETWNVEASDWLPAIDVQEDTKQFIIHADIPGVEMKDIDVNVDNHMLIIKGQREAEKKEKKDGYIRVERSKGSFYRSLNLPDTADIEKINAKYNNGVLTLSIPKCEKSVGRKIEVKA